MYYKIEKEEMSRMRALSHESTVQRTDSKELQKYLKM